MDATMENKMGLPPPYEQMPPHPAPPPSYYANAPSPPPPVTDNPRTLVVTSAPRTNTASIKMGPGPTGTVCPTCNKSIVTRVEYVSNNRTHIVSAALCVIAGCCCGCLVPYCIKSCKTANHYCPQCRAFIGTHVPS
ncbi:lipopolysaccharide-induced tumor necrosis factor-alpha factor-like [Vanessa tameamea]|uniref:Lipopolysaccharide-induced tumor necrosis factor-alpha factor-like n=1 Tax=Vanessa tameamea TaxID=334116 RepID=A0A8B8HIR8_VANTA|nr:lipopolysaccharide-induced tumor necrosis factor-alpha factor-like [Vanessa tameamea]XP_046971631.1 lipopolysaccharide-induced tumor necrosis factor-alpha factor-like [Vanessa cardui]XP_047542368.1 lipopolysaccharide-induced tumor necrosis factor-alpha factor-like [Vanessa atalanta]